MHVTSNCVCFSHYQKFAKYQRIYWRNMSVGNLRLKLPTNTFPSVIQSVTTDWKFPSVVTDWITDGIVSELKKGGSLTWRFWRVIFFWQIQNDSPYSDVTGSPFKLPMDSPRDLKWQIHTVTCLCFRQNHRRSFHRWNRRKRLIYVSSADPLLPYFSFFFLIPTLPICKQPAPLPKKKSSSYQHNKLYFLKFCGHNIRVLIYRWILSIFISNSIFLNFNI